LRVWSMVVSPVHTTPYFLLAYPLFGSDSSLPKTEAFSFTALTVLRFGNITLTYSCRPTSTHATIFELWAPFLRREEDPTSTAPRVIVCAPPSLSPPYLPRARPPMRQMMRAHARECVACAGRERVRTVGDHRRRRPLRSAHPLPRPVHHSCIGTITAV
jgi:hypothetical protein